MPAQAPDGRSSTWNGSQWVRGAGRIGSVGLTIIAIGLWAVELIWALVVVFILIFVANEEYVARGSIGYESIATTSVSAPFLASLLILPALITVLFAAQSRRHWWIGFVVGGWPVIVLIGLSGPNWLLPFTIVVVVIAGLVVVAWWVHRRIWANWEISADGQNWTRGGRYCSTLSTDARWRWDGRTWLPLE
jgi:hypothetical protein